MGVGVGVGVGEGVGAAIGLGAGDPPPPPHPTPSAAESIATVTVEVERVNFNVRSLPNRYFAANVSPIGQEINSAIRNIGMTNVSLSRRDSRRLASHSVQADRSNM